MSWNLKLYSKVLGLIFDNIQQVSTASCFSASRHKNNQPGALSLKDHRNFFPSTVENFKM